ncbi:MAG TPA: hypothetical protein DGG95_00695 [Cytophagales bacterium]|jgi:hypothetical protein|nr:hypothetical protein [Cytophagales bacterium]
MKISSSCFGLQLAIVIFLAIGFFSCGSDAKLKAENEALRHQLDASNKVVETLKTVNTLLDSIDLTRHSVRLLSVDKKDTNTYSLRMNDLKDYVKRSEDQIRALEASLAEDEVNADSYMTIIDALKDELKIRNEEIGIMQDNEELNTTVNLKSSQLDDIEMKLQSKKEELKLLQMQINEMVRTMKISQADSYFAQAGALEEAAKRTKLAPNKKKDTYQQALDLYEKALKLGKKEAKAKVDDLKTKVD